MSYNDNLSAARVNKNDEFYTLYEDIEKELKHYNFKDKIVYCPCDDPNVSNFTKYFKDNFEKLGIKRLVSTCYPQGLLEVVDKDSSKSLKLKGDGDFRSEECGRILRNCDIVVTNPPFSLFREFIRWVGEKDFLIIGNKNSYGYNEVFEGIKEGKIFVGFTSPKKFYQPIDDEVKHTNGLTRWFSKTENLKKFGNIGWLSSLGLEERSKVIPTMKYDSSIHKKYDNYDAINVDKVKDIPCDYFGKMGVPITYLEKHNDELFEIVGLYDNHAKGKDDGTLISGELVRVAIKTGGERNWTGAVIDGKTLYARVIIQRRTTV
jgi:hypothetical protein